MSDAAHKTPDDATPVPHKGLSKIEIIGFLGVVIIAQIVLAIMFIPKSGAATAAAPAAHGDKGKEAEKPAEKHGEEKHGEEKHGEAEKGGHDAEGAHDEYLEVSLGKFSLTSFDPNSNTTLLIDFQLYATVPVEH